MKPAQHGDREHDERELAVAVVRGRNGERHGQAAGEQDERVDGADQRVELGRGVVKVFRILGAIDGIQQEHPAEERDFRD